ncbi:hypothetical protein C0Q70_13464 [Pomacea canaliculata]|uniref:DAN domain-containing protein n=1 Tax=Pomacea canaliculata TaxID=400727 RepID=A0A2T7NXA4_POMCA|nr:thyrostimulin alpha-2 subunit-like [Pomacea canaliculata]PVD25804.1 hypothetical protein C0Q70_13464 [Pomacea canaliculata]
MNEGTRGRPVAPLMVAVTITLAALVGLAHPGGATGALSSARHSWERPGCHLVGHTRVVRIPDCVPFRVTTNACRGFCLSYAIPSPMETTSYNPDYVITSRAECCSIFDTLDVPVQVRCLDGARTVVFKSARSCSCSICRRE